VADTAVGLAAVTHPNWMTRLPDYAYRGDDPDGYLAASGVVDFIEEYAKETVAPVRANTTVTSVRPMDRGCLVRTDQDLWHARSVVLAPGARTIAKVPALEAGRLVRADIVKFGCRMGACTQPGRCTARERACAEPSCWRRYRWRSTSVWASRWNTCFGRH
jgi:hypothetical protein